MQTTTQSHADLASWIARRERFIPRGLATTEPIVVDHAHGAEVWDIEGKRYIDFAGGIGTLNVGHTADEVVRAVRDQAAKLTHMAIVVAYYEGYIELAERLAGIVPIDRPTKTLLLNSGAEAVENAVKIARAATGRPAVVSFENSFHGRTNMTMSLTGKQHPYKEGFGPFAADVYHARYPYHYRCACGGNADVCDIERGEDLERFFATVVAPNTVAALIVEPVQGEGGFVVGSPRFLQRLREICDREGILLIADEVQTGFGRTGRMFGIEHSGVQPDLVVLAKSLASGLPLSAVVGRADIMDAPNLGSIGGTYGGNPIACAAALAVLDIFEEQRLVERAQRIGDVIATRFREMASTYPIIGEARGLGAMQAIELVKDRGTKEPARKATTEIIRRCLDGGLIILKAGLYDNVIRVLAPLTTEEDLLRQGLDTLESAVAGV